MDWGGHGVLSLPGELLMDSGGGTVFGVYQAAIQFQTHGHTPSWLESEGHKTKEKDVDIGRAPWEERMAETEGR